MATFTLGWIQLAVLVGALQGLFLTAALLSQQKNRTANRLLGTLMGAFTIYLASSVYYDAGLVRTYPHFFGIAYPMPWAFGPLVYLYALAASDRTWTFTHRGWVHFLPFAIIVLVGVPYYMMSGADKVALFDRLTAGDVPARVRIPGPTKYISGIGYSIATLLHLQRHARRIELSYSNTARVNLHWLLWLSGGAAAIWLLATTMPIAGFNSRLREEHVSLAMAMLVYAIGYAGLRQPEIFRYETPDIATAEFVIVTHDSVVEGKVRYEKSAVDAQEAGELISRLMTIMDEQAPWKDSELTLAGLAADLGTTPHKLSAVLNTEIGLTFYDFVNGYRVREVQRRIRAGEAKRFKMLSLALDAGFASKSTFNNAFKKHTNVTPSDFQAASGA